MKKKHLFTSIGLMLVVLIAVLGVLPKLNVTIKEQQSQSYVTEVFDQSKVTSVDITIDENDLDAMLESPMDETMYAADVVINGEKVENVGLRVKGNMTLRSVAQMEDSDRYSFKIDFDKYVDEQNLHGLKKMNLNNNYTDPSLMREYLSYSLMQEMGIPTPAFSYMYITINGQEWGLYLGVEAVEETFLNRTFADGKGDLYKPDGVGSDLQWISDKISDYSGLNLKTNNGDTDQSAMIAMLDAINHDGEIEKVLNVDEMLRYFALNTALVSLDSYQGNMKHNYYLYEENGVFSIIPWDYNMSFGGFSMGGGPGGGGGRPPQAEEQPQQGGQQQQPVEQQQENQAADRQNSRQGQRGMGGPGGMDIAANFLNDQTINFSIVTPVSGTTLEDRPLLNALLSVDEYREQYYKYLDQIATQFFTEEKIGSMTAEIDALISDYVEIDPTKFYTLEQFKEGVSGEKSLVQFAVKRAESILAQRSGELVVEVNTTNQMGGPGGNPGQPPQMNGEQNADNMQLPQKGDAQNAGNRQRPQMGGRPNNGEMGFPPLGGSNGQQANSNGYSWEAIVIPFTFILLLIAATLFAFFFKRRRAA